jgi:hypothetical protein
MEHITKQPRSNMVKDQIADLLTDFHNILNRQNCYFSQLFNVHSDVRQM